jgi:rhodanese-related sulfurtransferase
MTTPLELAPTEALRLIEAGAVLLDVREDHEWAAGHAPDATHMAMGVLAAEHSRLPRDRPIVCVCLAGGRSALAAEALRQAGFDTCNLSGGMNAWAAAGLPVVTSSGEPGSVI